MGDHEQQLKDLKQLGDLAKPLLPLAGMSGAAVDAVTFVFGMVWRLLRIGDKVKAAVEKAGADLKQEIKTRGLYRVPVSLDTTTLQIRNFIALGQRSYPRAIEQLRGDIQRMDDRFDRGRRDARERLAIAMSVIPEVYDCFEREGRIDLRDEPLLKDDDLRLMGADDGNMYAALVDNIWCERRSVLEGDETSLPQIRDRIPDYVRFRLGLERDRLDAAHAEAFNKLQSALRDIYWTAVLGSEDGILADTLKFAKEQSVKALEDERSSLTNERTTISSQPADERPPGRLEQIDARLDELASLLARVKELEV